MQHLPGEACEVTGSAITGNRNNPAMTLFRSLRRKELSRFWNSCRIGSSIPCRYSIADKIRFTISEKPHRLRRPAPRACYHVARKSRFSFCIRRAVRSCTESSTISMALSGDAFARTSAHNDGIGSGSGMPNFVIRVDNARGETVRRRTVCVCLRFLSGPR